MAKSIWKARYKNNNLDVGLQFIAEDYPNAKNEALRLAKVYGLTLYKLDQIYFWKGDST
jgi:hypothetical protein